MHYASHGGQCCGITHLYTMVWPGGANAHAEALNQLNKAIDRIINKRYGWGITAFRRGWFNREDTWRKARSEWNTLIEVVINRAQYAGWAPVLMERGFKLVTTFNNSNSNNTCFVFHLQTAQKEEK